MSQEFQPQTVKTKEDIQTINANFEALKTIIRQINADLQKKADKPK